jgi:hypothetical protein
MYGQRATTCDSFRQRINSINAHAILDDYRQIGEKVWTRFNAGKDQQLWYYNELAKVFANNPNRLTAEFGRVVDELDRISLAPSIPNQL